jgi:hypothetical protein
MMGEIAHPKAMKMVRAGLSSAIGGVDKTSFDFGELETVCKFDVGAHWITDTCAPARVAREGIYCEQYLVVLRSSSATRRRVMMQAERCIAGIDVHKKMLAVVEAGRPVHPSMWSKVQSRPECQAPA